jgi:hypothetical protein
MQSAPSHCWECSKRVPHALDGCYLKLDRAAEHIDTFDSESEQFLAEKPFAVTPQVNAEGTRCVYWFESTQDPPPRLSLIIGDCVANLKSALDRFAYQVSVLAGKNSVTTVQFPIFTSEREFRDPQRGQRMIRDIKHATARTLIEDLQPFQRPSSVRATHPLAVLERLFTIDQYRLMPLARPYAVAVRINGGGVLHPLPSKPFGKKTVIAALPAHAPPEQIPTDVVAPRLVLAFNADHIPYTGESAARVLRMCGTAVLGVLSEAQRRGLFPERAPAAG